MGVLPIAIGLGTGSESRRPLGIAIVGGLALSQLLTHPSHGVPKEYVAEVAGGTPAAGALRSLRQGIELQ